MIFDSSAFLLDDTDDSDVVNTALGAATTSTSTSSTVNAVTSTGLGYSKKRKSSTVDDALEKRLLERKRKDKKKTGLVDRESESRGTLHGILEDEEALLSARMAKKPNSIVPRPAAPKSAVAKTDPSVTKIFEKSTSVPPQTQVDEPPKRKKSKTRSKQKNIRRDTRADELKPDHIRNGGGRVMTEVGSWLVPYFTIVWLTYYTIRIQATRIKLGLPPVSLESATTVDRAAAQVGDLV
jgi:hypothetical protein